MRAWTLSSFGLDHLELRDVPESSPGPGEVAVDVEAVSLNYRDLLVVRGHYDPRFELPATPLSDGAGRVVAVGEGVEGVKEGDLVVSHFIAAWDGGPYRGSYARSTLGLPGPGLAAEKVVLPAKAVVRAPASFSADEAATLPIAALTAWSGLVTEGRLGEGGSMLALGTGGVAIFGVQLAKALGARSFVTSSSDEKIARAVELGAEAGVNYREDEAWERTVHELSGGEGVDVTLETGGAGTLDRSVRATRPGGTIAMIGVLAGGAAEFSSVTFMMRRQRLAGILVGSRDEFESMNRFLETTSLRPVIDRRFAFDELPEALRTMARGEHFGKIVVDVKA
jgi:NADPH:quinone reductase-like Zn-dependent oxidoreductase